MTEAVKASGRVRSVLVGVVAEEEFAGTPALTYAKDLAVGHGVDLSLYVFPPPPSAALSLTAGFAVDWLAHETERLEQTCAATAHAACHAITSAGIQVIAEHASSPFEPRNDRFVKLARVHDLRRRRTQPAGSSSKTCFSTAAVP